MMRRLSRSPLARAAAVFGFIAVAALSVLAAREVALGRAHLKAADDDAARDDWAGAIAQLRAAAEARAPGSPWPRRAAARLEEIAHEAEMRGDDDTALLAYGALRAAALSTRALGSSRASWRHDADEGVARIGDRRQIATGAHERAASTRENLQREDAPPMWALAAMTCAALAMVGGLSGLARRHDGRGSATAAGAIALAGLVVYAVVLLMN